MIIEMDTRNQKDKYVTDYFDKHNIKWIRNKLYSGDVKLLNDTRVIIDLKANIEEIAHNLCNTQEHARIHRELDRAREIQCEEFIFLIKNDKIKNIEDLQNWTSKRTKVTGKMLCKVMQTMKNKYGVRFMICPRKDMGKRIIELLKKEGE
jgi:beta-mannanase